MAMRSISGATPWGAVIMTAIIALATGIFTEFIWSLALFEIGKSFPFSWLYSLYFFAFFFAVMLAWTIWGIFGLESRAHFANAFSWPKLLPRIRKSKPVTAVIPG